MRLAQNQWFPRSGIQRPTGGQGGEWGEGLAVVGLEHEAGI